ncbi:MAG: hypothetical protein J6R29_04785 [Clostridia bacterium]|nr:hypothetical protein [Clostridia bacterium]
MKKLVLMLLCICLTFGVVACKKPGGNTIEIQVITGVDSGLGLQWADVMKEKVEEKLKDNVYGNKTGVTWTNVPQDGAIGNFSTDAYHIYFINGGTIQQGMAQDAYLELTELYTRKNEIRDGEQISLEDKIFDEMRAAYGIKQNDGSWKYFGLPYQEYYCGLSYNRVLWDKYGLYFVTEECPDAIQIGGGEFDKTYYIAGSDGVEMDADKMAYTTPGPDGDMETEHDNGMPSSWFELVTFCEYMYSNLGVSPFGLSGQHMNYSNSMLEGLYESLLGQDRAQTTRDFTGELDVVVGYENQALFPNASGLSNIKKPKVQRITITEDSGYYSSWTVEKYFTTLLIQIIENYAWWSNALGGNLSHLQTQKEFLYGVYRDTNEVAMLTEYSYWQNESIIRSNYDEVLYNSNGLYGVINDLDVRWMPLPVNIEHQVTGEDQDVELSCVSKVGSTSITENTLGEDPTLVTLVGSLNTVVAVNKFNVQPGTDMYDAVLDALAVVYSDECMSAATASTGQFWTLDYSLNDDDKLVTTKFYNDLNTMRQAGKVFYQISDSEVYNKNMNTLFVHGFGSKIFGFGSAPQNAVQVYRIPSTKVIQKTWVKDAHASEEGTKNHIRSATMMFEELMVDCLAWKGIVDAETLDAIIVDNARYAPCYDNGGYIG